LTLQARWGALAEALALSMQRPTRGDPQMLERMTGLYVHQHWPYHHPYAARTWSLTDWRGYASGLRVLGFDTILVWPVLETMPDPPLDSDRGNLARMAAVIDLLHQDLGMRVYLALCPNVVADDEIARRAPFAQRHFFHCDLRVDPSDAAAVERMMRIRGDLLRPLRQVDGVTIIDSDPGGYPGSTTAEYVALLEAHRRLLDRLRPGIELVYWVHAGWGAYCRFYETGEFAWGREDEFLEALERLRRLAPEPWGLANGLAYASRMGLEDRVISFNYGAIEGEPTFPLTNYGGDAAFRAGSTPGPRGVMGNAQTHCVQLPNTFAFARGSQGRPVSQADYELFADRLLAGRGARIARAWQLLSGQDPAAMRDAASELEQWQAAQLETGDLAGLLFGDPGRLVLDLAKQLRLQAGCQDLCSTIEEDRDHRPSLAEFVRAADLWQSTHGYQNRWAWPRLTEALKRLGSPALDRALDPVPEGATPFDRVKASYFATETHTTQVLLALKRHLQGL
jgi:hypothetical protein